MDNVCREIREDFKRNSAVCAQVVSLFQLISNKGRFRIICLLTHGEFCVRDIMEVVGEGKLSNISQQLKILTLAGIIQRRRDRTRILYSLKDKRVRNIIGFLRDQFLKGEETA